MSAAETYDVQLERTIHVPVARLWAAWTEPEVLMRWWGPRGFSCPKAELDVRVGGTSLVAMRGPEELGMPEIHNTWTYTLVDPTQRLEFISRFVAPNGEAIGAEQAGIPDGGVPEQVPHVLTFASLDEQASHLRVVESGYTDAAARDLSAAGMAQCLDKLDEFLSGPRP